MYSTSAAYKSTIVSRTRASYVSGSITLADNTIITVLDSDIKSLSTYNQCCPDDGFDVGFSCTGEMELSIYDSTSLERTFKDAKIDLTYYLKTDTDTYEGVPIGIYFVDTATRDTANSIKLTAYDAMTKFDVTFPGTFPRSQFFTPFQGLKELCTDCGVELWDDDVNVEYLITNLAPNGTLDKILVALSPEITTARDYLNAICQLLCAFATIDRFGKLKIQCWRWAGPATGYAIPHGLRKSTTITTEEFGYNQLNMQVSFLQSSETKLITAPITPSDTGSLLQMSTNPLIRGSLYADAQVILNNVAECLCNTDPDYSAAIMRWHPCTVQCTGDPAIDLGDWMTYTGYTAGEALIVPIHKNDWTYHGYQTLQTIGAVINNSSVNSQRSTYNIAASASTVVVDNLSSTSTSAALSANQGRVLNGKIGDIGAILASVVEG